MNRCLPTIVILRFCATAIAQGPDAAKSNPASSTPATSAIAAAPAITANSTPIELARAALAAQGGDKFKNLKSMMLIGSADLFAPNSASSIPGRFVIGTDGDKVSIEIDPRPIFIFKHVYDGQQSYS